MIDKIIKSVKDNVNKKKKEGYYDNLPPRLFPLLKLKDFFPRGRVSVIAEVKKASPSLGAINLKINPARQAELYEKAGAAAVSVLTEEKFFKGKINYLSQVKKRVQIPVLRKDFIIDEAQIYEAYAFGADAVLLISDILKFDELKKLYSAALKLKLSVLAECHTVSSLKKILKAGCPIIGINNRNLKNLKIDIKTTRKIIKYIPKTKTVIAESGIAGMEDFNYLKESGINGVLIGTALMKSAKSFKLLKKMTAARAAER